MHRPLPLAGILIALLAGAPACWDNHVPVPDAATVDPGRTDPSDPVPACSATCEDHFGALCTSPTQGLCTCAPRGNSGKGRWDCITGWAARTPACAAGADHGTACPRVIDGIGQICAGPSASQVCHCSTALAWRCMIAP